MSIRPGPIRRAHNDQGGMSILELLIAAVIGGIVIASALNFYVVQHHSWLMQGDVSDAQQNARASLEDIQLKLRMAGLNLTAHPAYEAKTDTLKVYSREGTDVDTVRYYINRADTLNPQLMRAMPGQPPKAFADGVEQMTFDVLNPSLIRVTLTARSQRTEKDFLGGDGYRRRQLTCDVRIRNLQM